MSPTGTLSFCPAKLVPTVVGMSCFTGHNLEGDKERKKVWGRRDLNPHRLVTSNLLFFQAYDASDQLSRHLPCFCAESALQIL